MESAEIGADPTGYPNVTVTDAADLPTLLTFGTKPTRTLTFNGRPLLCPLRESGTLSVAVFSAFANFRYTVARFDPLPLMRPAA